MKCYVFTVKWGLNHCLDIRSAYSLYQYSMLMDIYHYGSKERRLLKRQYNLTGIVEDHHLIPKKFKNHSVIVDTKFPINSSKNIKMMPNLKYDVPSNILVHCSHEAYNHYVYKHLEAMTHLEKSDKMCRLGLFVRGLSDRLDVKDCLPWN